MLSEGDVEHLAADVRLETGIFLRDVHIDAQSEAAEAITKLACNFYLVDCEMSPECNWKLPIGNDIEQYISDFRIPLTENLEYLARGMWLYLWDAVAERMGQVSEDSEDNGKEMYNAGLVLKSLIRRHMENRDRAEETNGYKGYVLSETGVKKLSDNAYTALRRRIWNRF